MAKETKGMLKSPMTSVGRAPSLRPAGRNFTGNPSKGLTKPHDCGPTDIPVVFTEDLRRNGKQIAKPARMSSPLGPATGTPARVRRPRG